MLVLCNLALSCGSACHLIPAHSQKSGHQQDTLLLHLLADQPGHQVWSSKTVSSKSTSPLLATSLFFLLWPLDLPFSFFLSGGGLALLVGEDVYKPEDYVTLSHNEDTCHWFVDENTAIIHPFGLRKKLQTGLRGRNRSLG